MFSTKTRHVRERSEVHAANCTTEYKSGGAVAAAAAGRQGATLSITAIWLNELLCAEAETSRPES